MLNLETPLQILKNNWGHDSFRNPQAEIIEAVLQKKNCIALLPTGAGKSVCYQIPGLLQKGVCIVISPLLALMQDQIDSLHRKNIKAVALNVSRTQDEMIVLFDNIQFNNIRFLYLSPEKLQSPFIQEKIKQLDVQLIAIDEAHCISEWGHDFRPSYLQLSILKELCPAANTIALTASATSFVLDDITKQLQLEDAVVYKTSYKRKNLAYQFFETEDKWQRVKQILTKIKSPTIIYTNTRNETQKISKQLKLDGFSSTFYHGGMNQKAKKEAYDSWFKEETQVVVATNAFGMGIDKPNIRVVLHLDLPNSIENYLQEAGRAGRDGKKAFAVSLINQSDILQYEKRQELQKIGIPFIKQVYFYLNQFYKISLGEWVERDFEFNLNEFCYTYKLPIAATYNTLKTLEIEGILEFNESFQKKSYLKFICSSDRVLDYCDKNASIEKFVQTILRTYGGLFENYIALNEFAICKKNNFSKKEFQENINRLQKDGIVKYIPVTSNATIKFLVSREDDRTINRISKNIKKQQNHKEEKTKELIRFIQNNKTCRSVQLLRYFNETEVEKCGICDVCLQQKKEPSETFEKTKKTLVSLLEENEEMTSKELSSLINCTDETLLNALQFLAEENIIKITKGNKYSLITSL